MYLQAKLHALTHTKNKPRHFDLQGCPFFRVIACSHLLKAKANTLAAAALPEEAERCLKKQ
jgi:hypothetical protein